MATLAIINSLGPSRKASPQAHAHFSTPAHLAPKWPLSQRGAAWRRQFGDSAPGGRAVGLEQMGCVFGKLQDVAGVCWLGVNGQDGTCGDVGEAGRGKEEREELEGQPVWLPPESPPFHSPSPIRALPLPHNPHPGLKASSLRLGAPQR